MLGLGVPAESVAPVSRRRRHAQCTTHSLPDLSLLSNAVPLPLDLGQPERRESIAIENKCIPAPFNQPRSPSVQKHEKIRGSDAVFWKVAKSENGGEFVVRDTALYEHYEPGALQVDIDEGDEEQKSFQTVNNIYKANVKPIAIPATAAVYHWSGSFPVGCVVGDTLITEAFTWTSTSDKFVWSAPERYVIILPEGTMVWRDPQSHSHSFVCDDNPMGRHQDVVLGPGKYVVVEDDEYERLTGKTIQQCERELAEAAVKKFFRLSASDKYARQHESYFVENETKDVWKIKYSGIGWYQIYMSNSRASREFLEPICTINELDGSAVVDFSNFQRLGLVLRKIE